MATLAVIPARAGSRGLPGKHLARIGGEPMIVHTIRAAMDARSIDRVIVSTNDPAVARTAERVGAEVLLRPDALAADETPTLPVVQHAVREAEAARGSRFDLVVTLQPTSPLRTAAHVDAAVALVRDGAARSAVSVTELGMPISVIGSLADGDFKVVEVLGDTRRQAAAPAARVTGGIYVTSRELLDDGRLLDGAPAALLLDEAAAVDVDTERDLAAARRWWRAGRR
jgi:CMP-N-acetylneuraminic acid synthetase